MNFLQHNIVQIIDGYESPQPLHLFLKPFFAANKKLGSRDRRSITEAVYLYYRLVRFYESAKPLDIIKQGVALGLTANQYLIHTFETYESAALIERSIDDLPELSEEITLSAYLQSLKQQPRIFIRLLRNQRVHKQKLQQSFDDIVFYELPIVQELIVSLSNGTKIQEILPETDYIVQDYSSQQVIPAAIHQNNLSALPIHRIWDVCSGAGGKLIMAKTIWPGASVLATDIRGNILKNLQMRIKAYGIKQVETTVMDIAQILPLTMIDQFFDLIVCDVPCSGSGTWARTPEQFAFFKTTSLAAYTEMQYSIANNAMQKLKPNGVFIYITCSAFKEENEEVVARLLASNEKITCIQQKLINGIQHKADSLFFAAFRYLN